MLPAEGLQREGVRHYVPTAFKHLWSNWYFEPLLVLCSAVIFENYNKLSVKIKSQSTDQTTAFIMYYSKVALLPLLWLFSKNRGMESEQLKERRSAGMCSFSLFVTLEVHFSVFVRPNQLLVKAMQFAAILTGMFSFKPTVSLDLRREFLWLYYSKCTWSPLRKPACEHHKFLAVK